MDRWVLLVAMGVATCAALVTAGCLGANAPSTPADVGLAGSTSTPNPSNNTTTDVPGGDASARDAGDEPPPMNATPEGPPAGPAPFDPGWPPLSEATIRPGVPVLNNPETVPPPETTAPHLCTSNFVFHSPDNSTLYLGTASHCTTFGLAVGDRVPIFALDGTTVEGTLAYCSFGAAMGTPECPRHEDVPGPLVPNDFALIRIDDDDRHLVHPAVRHWGGPTGLWSPAELVQGERALTFGATRYRFGTGALDAREGYVWGGNASTTRIQFEVPSIQGDSGSAVLAGDGRAIGVMQYLGDARMDGTPPTVNGVANLEIMLGFARAHGLDVAISTWRLLEDGDLPAWPAPP